MGKPRSLLLKLEIDQVAKRHSCQHSKTHVLTKGDRRLKVTVGRTDEHYCVPCARKFIQHAMDRLTVLDRQLADEAALADAVAASPESERMVER